MMKNRFIALSFAGARRPVTLRHIIFVMFLLCCWGCSVLKHKDQLLTLRAYSRNKDEQAAWVADYNQRFEQLLLKVKAGEIASGQPQSWFLQEFGDPVLRMSLMQPGVLKEKWLYRYATRYFDSPKVYLSFDGEGQLQKLEYIPSSAGTNNQGGNDGTFVKETKTEEYGSQADQVGR
jgi:hypothetical protein